MFLIKFLSGSRVFDSGDCLIKNLRHILFDIWRRKKRYDIETFSIHEEHFYGKIIQKIRRKV